MVICVIQPRPPPPLSLKSVKNCSSTINFYLLIRKLSVCPSVRLSVKRVNCNKTEERSVQIFIPYERSFTLVLLKEERLVGATPST